LYPASDIMSGGKWCKKWNVILSIASEIYRMSCITNYTLNFLCPAFGVHYSVEGVVNINLRASTA